MIKKRKREKLIFEINITPLTDVMLVLLVIFMVTTPFIIQGNIKINLPKAKTASDETMQKNIIVSVDSEGLIYLNGKVISDIKELKYNMKKEIKETGNARVIIEGDKLARHGRIVEIMGAAKEAGAEKLAVSIKPQADSGE